MKKSVICRIVSELYENYCLLPDSGELVKFEKQCYTSQYELAGGIA